MTRMPLLALVLLALLPAAAHAAVPPGTTWSEHYIDSGDGTKLHVDVIRPENGPAKMPTILAVGPYFAHIGSTGAVGFPNFDPRRSGPNERFKDLWTEGKIFERGYTMVQADLRGFGASEGCNDFGGPGEQADVKAVVEWAASQEWSNGKIGMWGKSYDAWTQVMALANKPKGLAAAVIQSPIIDGYRALYMNGVHYDAGWYATPALYQNIDASPPTIFDKPEYYQGVAKGTDPACYAQNIAEQNATSDKSAPFWQERDLVPRARGTDVPTLWSHGFLDANTKPDNFLDVFSFQTGPRRAWFGQYTHIRPQDKRDDDDTASATGREGFIDEAMRWMDRYVKGVEPAQARVEEDPAVEVEDGGLQKYRAEAFWPPLDAQSRTLTLNAGRHTDRPGNNGRTGPGTGIWSITAPLPHDVHMTGVPHVTLDVTTSGSNVNLYGIVYDIDERRTAMLVSRGAFRLNGSGKVEFDLYPQDWTFRAGHRLGFLVAQSDDEWFNPPPSNQNVEIKSGTMTAPFLTNLRSSFLPSRPSQDEEQLPAGFQVDVEDIQDGAAAFETPPRMRQPSDVILPVTLAQGTNVGGAGAGASGRFLPRLTVKLRRLKRNRWLVTGRAPAGYPPLIRLQRRKAGAKRFRTVGWRRPPVNRGSFRRTFKAKLPGRYRTIVTLRAAGVPVKVTSRTIRKRR
ncbi:MAG TPA: CocE/NonD family hydrolase [Solirubrobacteraceae bacterium]|nr:CocE/NonD family hydrolase [Solirubrobacteraceae bacterium]